MLISVAPSNRNSKTETKPYASVGVKFRQDCFLGYVCKLIVTSDVNCNVFGMGQHGCALSMKATAAHNLRYFTPLISNSQLLKSTHLPGTAFPWNLRHAGLAQSHKISVKKKKQSILKPI